MNPDVLIIPRRLAILVLHEAQLAQPEPIHGWVTAKDGEPAAYVAGTTPPVNQPIWARLWSYPSAPAVPEAQDLTPGELALLISLNTKGVLEMRAWQLQDGQVVERVLRVIDQAAVH